MVLAIAPTAAYAFSLNPSNFTNPNALIDPDIVAPIVKGIGFATDHRAYEGATAAGFDISMQAILVKMTPGFRDALSSAGMGSLPMPIIPVPRLILHKGIGSRFDAGFSWIFFKEVQITGFDAKVVAFQPEEGPTWAVRLNYSISKLEYGNSDALIAVHTQTLKPEILVSQKLDFAEPYLGIGYQFVRGDMKVYIPLPAPIQSIDKTVSAKGGGGLVFIGLGLKVPGIALRLLVDGEYSTAGAHALGAKFGLNF